MIDEPYQDHRATGQARADDSAVIAADPHIPTVEAAGGRLRSGALLGRDDARSVQRQHRLEGECRHNPLMRGAITWEHVPDSPHDEAVVVIEARTGWWGGPVHAHPHASEQLTVHDGRLGVHMGGSRRVLTAGQRIVIPAGVDHTVWNAGLGTLVVTARLQPGLAMAEFFERMFGVGMHGPQRVPGQVRELATGFDHEIQWRPRWRKGALLAGGVALALVLRRRRRRRG